MSNTLAYSMGKAARIDGSVNKQSVTNPGPGTYSSKTDNQNYKSSPCWGVGSGTRNDIINSSSKKNPGPGSYNLPSKVIEGPKYVMGLKTSNSNAQKKFVPGPGAYNTKQQLSDNHSIRYSMGAKTKIATSIIVSPDGGHQHLSQSQETTPGPGTYASKPVYRKVNTGARFGTESRATSAKPNGTPGPQAYNQDSKRVALLSAPKYGFGTSKRPQSQHTRLTAPGPGNYEARPIIGKETQGKTMGCKLRSAVTSNRQTPGPGTYSSTFNFSHKKAPTWCMGTSTRDDTEKSKQRTQYVPPPNSYDPNFGKTKTAAATWSFGTGGRSPSTGKGNLSSPAPGTYQTPSKAIEGPKFHMGLKLDNQSSIGTMTRTTAINPGPGNYNPNFRKTVKTLPSYSLKSRTKAQQDSLKVPGPGSYESTLKSKKSAPQYGFGTANQRVKARTNQSPGPGNYHIPTMVAQVPSYVNTNQEFKYI